MATAAEKLKEYEDLFAKANSYDTSKFQSDFEKAYNEATNYNKDLITQRNAAISEAQAMPAQLREQYYSSPIRNPLTQESLIATRRGAVTQDVSNLNDLLTARGNKYSDVLSKALSAYQTAASQAQNAADSAWNVYQSLLSQEGSSSGTTLADILSSLSSGTTDTSASTGTDVQVQDTSNSANYTKSFGDWLGSQLVAAENRAKNSKVLNWFENLLGGIKNKSIYK